MKVLPAGLQDHLDSGVTTIALAWKVTRADGTVQGFTEHDLDLEFSGVTYLASAGFTASRIEQSLGLAVDNLNALGALQAASINETDLARGLYDGAGVDIWAVNWRDTAQRVLIAAGSIGKVMRGKTGFEAEVRSLAHVLGQASGRTYQYHCDADLGDHRCTVDLDDPALTASGVVTGAQGTEIAASGLEAHDDGWFAGGRLSWTAGANAGLAAEVRAFASGTVTLWAPPPEPIAPGDTFDISAGCDKAFATCAAKFANTVNFRGFPHMPGNDVVQSYPNRGEIRLDGGSLIG